VGRVVPWLRQTGKTNESDAQSLGHPPLAQETEGTFAQWGGFFFHNAKPPLGSQEKPGHYFEGTGNESLVVLLNQGGHDNVPHANRFLRRAHQRPPCPRAGTRAGGRRSAAPVCKGTESGAPAQHTDDVLFVTEHDLSFLCGESTLGMVELAHELRERI